MGKHHRPRRFHGATTRLVITLQAALRIPLNLRRAGQRRFRWLIEAADRCHRAVSFLGACALTVVVIAVGWIPCPQPRHPRHRRLPTPR